MNPVDVEIDDRVLDALHKQKWVPVVVVLQSIKPPGKYPEKTDQHVARIQQEVLSTLSAEDFQLKHRYEMILSFARSISREGLIKLQADPYVKKIQYDGADSPQ